MRANDLTLGIKYQINNCVLRADGIEIILLVTNGQFQIQFISIKLALKIKKYRVRRVRDLLLKEILRRECILKCLQII